MNKVDIYNQLINLHMHKSLIFKTKSLDVEIKANNRKETRHYVINKPTIEPHKALSKKERIDYFNLSSILIHNVIRKKLGLSPQVIKRV